MCTQHNFNFGEEDLRDGFFKWEDVQGMNPSSSFSSVLISLWELRINMK
jgi:hypothetical protein